MGLGIGITDIFSRLSSGGLSYKDKTLAIEPANLIAYWLLNETAGVTADNAEGTAARDGTYTGVSLDNSTGPDGQPVGLWDGANDTCNIHTASLAAAIGTKGTLSFWAKVSAAGVWTDSTNRVLFRIALPSTHFILVDKMTTNNQLRLYFEANNTIDQVLYTTPAPTAWFHVAMTYDDAADEFKAFFNGSQVGTTQNSIGTWLGGHSLSNIGSNNAPAAVWDGWLAHVALWDTALTPAQILELATV